MRDDRAARTFAALGRALERLHETQRASPDDHPFLIDAAIQRFEFSFELFWKVLKRLHAYEGVEAVSPRQTLRAAFAQGWLSDEPTWLDMLDDRNRTSHVYDEAAARAIFGRIGPYVVTMAETHTAVLAWSEHPTPSCHPERT